HKRHYICSCKISQPQPPGGKKRHILTSSKAHVAGNTSSREDNTFLTAVAESNAGITYEFLLVLCGAVITNININGQFTSNNLASSRHQECIQDHKSTTYEKDKRSLSRAQHLSARFITLTNSKSWRSQKRSSWKYCMHTKKTTKR
ncbi:hypothetical protein HID58_002440, partial [Brassica napus]